MLPLKEINTIKNLAGKYMEIATNDENYEKYILHRRVNDLKQIRPVVLLGEIPWNELKNEPDLILTCENESLRSIEWYFRREIYSHKNFRADRIYKPYFSVPKVINSTGIGINTDENTIEAHNGVISSHYYNDMLRDEADLEKLETPVISFDNETTNKNFEFTAELLNKIIPVKIDGIGGGYGISHKIWDTIATLKGVTNLLIDLAERPEFMHKIADRLTNITIETALQYEKLGLLSNSALYVHETAGGTNDLEAPADYENVKLENVWGRGLAQIFASVSPAMHDEFDIQYAKKSLAPYKLSYYGCCEPLDKKIDILRQIKNLRKISITPWADINIAAETIGKDYVVSVKPNPAALSTSYLDEQAVKKELKSLTDACYKNNCAFELVLKDISSVGGNPENLTKWTNIATSFR